MYTMNTLAESGRIVPAADALKARIVSFMQDASTEIVPAEEDRLPELQSMLPVGTAVYIAHTPHASFAQVIHAALAARRAGFLATPHIAVRRVPNARILRGALAELRDGGVERILLIAGDAPQPMGEFSSTLDVLVSGLVQESGINQIGIAGHPEGHGAVDGASLWRALEAKQSFAASAGMNMHIVTQFGLDAGAFARWESELKHRCIKLPVRLGIAGPAPLAKLLHFAIQCGIRASMRALTDRFSSASHVSQWASCPDQHLLSVLAAPISPQVLAPHFFAFGGALETAGWMQKIRAGLFDVDVRGRQLRLLA
jgi:methylenetetrahydrofolate reductase (NADPH)